MLQPPEAGGGYQPAPFFQVIEHAEAVNLPCLLVLPTRVRDQKHALGFQGTTQINKHPLNVSRGYMEQRRVGKDAIESTVRKIKIKKILLPHLTARRLLGDFTKLSRCV